MTASEFAFLALGLVLGVASGSALVMVLGSRPAAREVRLTVEHDAVPRRGATLSSDAFNAAHGEVARGGPADRRVLDRDMPVSDPRGRAPVPVLSSAAPWASISSNLRTSVPSGPISSALSTIPVAAGRDPAIDALRIQAALTAERMFRAGLPTASAVLDPKPADESDGAITSPALAWPAVAWPPSPTSRATAPAETADPAFEAGDDTPALVRILRGDHRALVATVASIAGDDEAQRRPWQTALMGVAETLVQGAIAEGCLDFPVGNPFWDTFTIEQCRLISGALAASGFRFDSVSDWEDGRVPGYRDLAAAVAGAGLEPRRIRAWPTQDEIAGLYAEVSVASDEYLAAHAPDLDLDEVREIVGIEGPERARLWTEWDRIRPILSEPVPAA